MTEELDVWELSNGLVDDFDGTVVDAYFGVDKKYNNGDTTLLRLVVKADEPDTFPEGNQTELLFTCGDGYTAKDKGASVVHESGKAKLFNRNSGMGLLITACAEIGLVETWKAEGKVPFDATIWKGLRFHWHNKEFSGEFKDKDTQEMIKRTWYRMLPTALLGAGESGSASPASTPAKEKGTDTPAEGGSILDQIDPANRGKLKAIAVAADTHDSFIEAAFTANTEWPDEVQSLLMESALYEALRAS